MKILTLDFETYYDKEYSLSKMTAEEYIRDDRFEVICVSVRDVDGDFHVIDGAAGPDSVARQLRLLGAEQLPVLAHNMHFDGAILAWRLGIVPPMYLDTLCMANAVIRHETGSASLKKMGNYFGLVPKGTAVHDMIGIRRAAMSPKMYADYAEYCKNDTMICYNSWVLLEKGFPRTELLLIDRMVRMYTQPKLLIDQRMCQEAVMEEAVQTAELVRESGQTVETLMSNVALGELLSKYVTVPKKTSLRTGKQATAFAKTDAEFMKLASHPNPTVQKIIAARLAVKSTIDRTRLQSFLDIADRNKGKLPVPLKYYGAITGRASGMDKINLQNLRRGSKMRYALRAPTGYYVVAADQAQIETRLNACWSGQDDLVEDFRDGTDIYSDFAFNLYGYPIEKGSNERFVGKTCILGLGYGMGRERLQDTLKIKQPVTIDFAAKCVDVYRQKYGCIKKNWNVGNHALEFMVSGNVFQWGPIATGKEHILLPNGMKIHYPELSQGADGEMRYRENVRSSRVGASGQWTKMYGAKLVENCVQALSRIILMDQLVRLSLKYDVVSTVHDEIVLVIHASQIQEAIDDIGRVMRKPPEWMPNLPVEVEIKYGETYGDCK